MSRRDLVLADKTWGALFWVEGTWVGPGNTAEGGWGWFFSWYAKGGWFDLPVPFPILPLFPNPLLFPTLSNTPLPLPKTLWWVEYGWHVVAEKKRLAAARPSPVRSPLGLTVFLISPRHIRSTSYRHPKFMKFLMQAPYTSIHYCAFLC